MSTETRQLDTTELERRVKRMYEEVAPSPSANSTSRTAARLPNDSATRSRPRPDPRRGIDSFAGVGYFLDLASVETGESVLDLGSGSRTDSFLSVLVHDQPPGGPQQASDPVHRAG